MPVKACWCGRLQPCGEHPRKTGREANLRKQQRNRELGRHTAAWQKFRLRILNRDGHACRDCRTTTQQLQAHRIGGGYHTTHDLDSYLSLCMSCHNIRQKREWQDENLKRLGLAK